VNAASRSFSIWLTPQICPHVKLPSLSKFDKLPEGHAIHLRHKSGWNSRVHRGAARRLGWGPEKMNFSLEIACFGEF